MPRTIAVVGGGVAGLVAARSLLRDGDDVIVLEAGPACGGAIRSGLLDGVLVDVGAEAFGVTRPETRALIDDLGLSDRVVTPRRSDAHLLLDDGLHAMPHAMLGVPTSLDAPDLVDVIGAEAAKAASERDAAPVEADSVGDESVTLGALVRDRMGAAVVDRVLTPVVAGVHAMDPDLVEAEAVIPGLRAAAREAGSLAGAAARLRSASGVPGAAVAGLHGGMTALVTALTDDVVARGAEVRTSVRVESVTPDGARWRIRLADDPPDANLHVDGVVLAVDAPAASRLIAAVPAVSDSLGAIAVGDVAVVALAVDSVALDADPVGSGVLVGPGHPQVRAKAMTHASAKWQWIRDAYGPGRHLVRLSYGRDGRIDEPLDDLVAIATADLSRITGADDVVVRQAEVVRWDRSLVQPTPGHRARVAAVRAAVAEVPGLAVVGAGLGGNGLAGTIATGASAPAQLADTTGTTPDGRLTT